MEQDLINWMLGGFGALFGFLLNSIWQAVKDLQRTDSDLVDRIAQIEVLVAGTYISRVEFDKAMGRLFRKLDTIDQRLGGKADK